MSESLRALASVVGAEQERRGRAHADAVAAEARARAALADARERCGEAETALEAAAREPVSTAAERVLADARRARLRDRLRAMRALRASAEAAVARALEAVETTRAALGTAHGEKRAVEVALERVAEGARVVRSRREDDEADDLRRAGR